MSHVSSASLPRAGRAQAGLSDTTLKVLALVLMVMDHIHYFFGFTGLIPEWFSMLGRLSAPLFLFCTVEGFAHTMTGGGTFGASGPFPPGWACCCS